MRMFGARLLLLQDTSYRSQEDVWTVTTSTEEDKELAYLMFLFKLVNRYIDCPGLLQYHCFRRFRPTNYSLNSSVSRGGFPLVLLYCLNMFDNTFPCYLSVPYSISFYSLIYNVVVFCNVG